MTEGFNTLTTDANDGLYHRDVFFPFDFDFYTESVRYGEHAYKACHDDRYGVAELPEFIDTEQAEVFEVEVSNGRITKIAMRQVFDADRDIIIVFNPQSNSAWVRTVWFNLATDVHSTLRRNKYVQV